VGILVLQEAKIMMKLPPIPRGRADASTTAGAEISSDAPSDNQKKRPRLSEGPVDIEGF
jgi:hypothetical protein